MHATRQPGKPASRSARVRAAAWLLPSLGVVVIYLGFGWLASAYAQNPQEVRGEAKPAAKSEQGVTLLAVDHVMEQDPALYLGSWNYRYPTHLMPLWLVALERPDAETRRLAADTFTIAVDRGLSGLGDAVGPLLKVATTDADPVVRRAAARAVIALDGKDAAAPLRELAAKDGLQMAQIVEPALARWRHAPMLEEWRKRISEPRGERGYVWLALRAMDEYRDVESPETLLKIVGDDLAPAELRVAAARVTGRIRDQGLSATADELCGRRARQPALGKLLAAELLANHSEPAALDVLKRLAVDAEATVAAAALYRLWKVDRQHALPFAAGSLSNRDAKVRKLGAEILCEQGDVESIKSLKIALNDRNPGVRQLVAAKYVEFARRDEALKAAVLEQATQMLASDQWRGLEQAALVLGELDHKPAAERLVALLPFDRGEVQVTAAWALRRLKVAATYPAIFARAQELDKVVPNVQEGAFPARQMTQIFQLFGEVKFRDAEALMRKYVPKSFIDVETRGAACWALGHLYADNPENDLVDQFVARLSDTAAPMPELTYVRRMTAIGLGRMRAERTLPVLKKFAAIDGPNAITGRACGWSVERMTGEKMPPASDGELGVGGWFLEPFNVPEPKP